MEKTEAGLKGLRIREIMTKYTLLHKILYYNNTVSDAMEICFVIIHHVLIDPEFKFVDIMQKNFLSQHVQSATRARGMDTPHLLDLVITETPDIIEDIDPQVLWVKVIMLY